MNENKSTFFYVYCIEVLIIMQLSQSYIQLHLYWAGNQNVSTSVTSFFHTIWCMRLFGSFLSHMRTKQFLSFFKPRKNTRYPPGDVLIPDYNISK